jgi:hypothetical protein
MIRKSGYRFSEKIMRQRNIQHDPEKWQPLFGKIMRQSGRRLNGGTVCSLD